MILTLILFCTGLILLIRGADYFVEGGSGLAARYGVAPATIGFTIIAFGTSLPEFVVSLNAIASGETDVALGNVLGSNIANIALVLALCAFIRPGFFRIKEGTWKNIPLELKLMLGATALFALLALRNFLDFWTGIVMLAAFILILRYLWKNGVAEEAVCVSHGKSDYFFTAGGVLAVIIGSQLVLTSAVNIATAAGIPAYVIGMSLVAVGTSLPELATSLVAILKGRTGISIGNILGSNIFNLLFVLGCGSLIGTIAIPSIFDVTVVIFFSLAVIPLLRGTEKTIRVWASCLIAAYCAYILFLF